MSDPAVTVRRVDTLIDGWPTLLWALIEVRADRGAGEPMLYQVPLGAAPDHPDELPDWAHLGRSARPEARPTCSTR